MGRPPISLPLALLCASLPSLAQNLPTCTTPLWEPCDLAIPLLPGESPSAQLRAEFRSPRRDTVPIRAFANGQTLILRFAPIEAGDWDYRLTSSIPRLDGAIGRLTATAARTPGFLQPANAHHFQTLGDLQPHLWLAAPLNEFASMPRPVFEETLSERSLDGFTHLRVTIDQGDDLAEAATRLRAINARGIIADLRLGAVPSTTPADRERYLTDIVARFAPFNITWAGVPPFENRPGAAAIARETGQLIAQLDGYHHIRTTGADTTSTPLLPAPRGTQPWMNLLSYGTTDPNVAAVEHEFYLLPSVNTGIRNRADLWNATMNGSYPGSGPSEEAKIWFDFMKTTRYWELEPYYDLDGGRAYALPDAEYIVYIEKPGPVEITVENRGYKVEWMNPATGERVKGKDYKGKRFVGEPPDASHDWVLHLFADGRLESLLKSYKFESRRVPVQEIETKAAEIPFDIASPAGSVSARIPPPYELKINRPTRATRDLLVLWTAENVAGGEGARVVGTGVDGLMQWTPAITGRVPGVLSLRVMILNAYGKAYLVDRAVSLTQ